MKRPIWNVMLAGNSLGTEGLAIKTAFQKISGLVRVRDDRPPPASPEAGRSSCAGSRAPRGGRRPKPGREEQLRETSPCTLPGRRGPHGARRRARARGGDA